MKWEENEFIEEFIEHKKNIVPIVGDKSFVCKWEKNGVKTEGTLQNYIMHHLLEERIPKEIENASGYYKMTLLREEMRIGNADFMKKVTRIVNHGVNKNEIILRTEIETFLNTGRFDVIVTTSPFNILKSKLEYDYNLEVFRPKTEVKLEEKLKVPTIYQIFGDSASGDAVLCEDELLYFLHYLQMNTNEKGIGPYKLINYLKQEGFKYLFPIGWDKESLPNWLFRFLWYPISPLGMELTTKSASGGYWYSEYNDAFETFLKNECFDYLKKGEIGILAKLTKEMLNADGTNTDNLRRHGVGLNSEGKWKYFLSYAKEGNEIPASIKALYDYLENKTGKGTVWLDARIEVGENYWDVIKYGLINSENWILAITNEYLDKLANPFRDGAWTGVYTELHDIMQALPLDVHKMAQRIYPVGKA